jgi:cobalt-zinc-cadmium efflux system membrane fusion protein
VPVPYRAVLKSAGVVKAIAGRIAEIAPPFDGRINKSFVALGQKVQPGAPVFELQSPDFVEAVRVYFQALQTRKARELRLLRQTDLVANGVGTVKDREEAETDFEIARRDHESAEASLRVFGIEPQELVMGQALKVASPIAGEVVQLDMVIGQYVKTDAAPLAIVADLEQVWVAAWVKERHSQGVHLGDSVQVFTDATPEQAVLGTVTHISELLDEETRSIQVLVTCSNTHRRLKPGMFADVHFTGQGQDALIVPTTALLQKEESSYVLVQAGPGKYLPRAVQAVMISRDEALVTEGLAVGDRIVSSGGIYLITN